MDKAGLPYWDSLILASTEAADCTYLLSEDFQAGQRFGDITVVDPFQRRPEEFGLA
jgi:predicted nucleic acid-binding protein